MTTTTLNLNVNQGDTFSQIVTVVSPTNLLTGYSVKARVRKWYGSNSSIPFTAAILTNTTIQISLTAEDTAFMVEGRYVYEISVISAAGAEYRTHEGQVIVAPGVDVSVMGNSPIAQDYATQAIVASGQAVAAAAAAAYNGLGAASVIFTFDTATADADPGSGKIRLNNAVLNLVTAAYIDDLNAAGTDVSAYLDTATISTSVVNKAILFLREATTGKYAVYRITGTTVNGTGYRKLTLIYVSASLGLFTNGNQLGLSYSLAGDKGSAAGADTQVQFRDGTEFGGSAAFTFNKTTNTLQLNGVNLFGSTNLLEQRNGASAQTLHVYNVHTDVNNWARLALQAQAGIVTIVTEAAGTGVDSTRQTIKLIPGGGGALFLGSAGSGRFIVSSIGLTPDSYSNTYDIGSTTFSMRTGHFGTSVITPFVSSGTTLNLGATGTDVYISPSSTTLVTFRAGVGIFPTANNAVDLGFAGTNTFRTGYFGTSLVLGGDVNLLRDAANTLAQRNGASAQVSRLYNGFVDAANYSRLTMSWASDIFTLTTEKAGTGAVAGFRIGAGAGNAFQFGANGSLQWGVSTGGNLTVATANSHDLGDPTLTVRTGYFGTSVVSPLLTVNGAGNATVPRIDLTGSGAAAPVYVGWAASGLGAPTFTTRSNGTKLVLYPAITGAQSDYAHGVETGFMWASAPTTSFGFRWYGGTTLGAELLNNAFRLYNSYTDASNYERLEITPIGVLTGQSGTGLARSLTLGTLGSADLILMTNGSQRWKVALTSGHLVPGLVNTHDLGDATNTVRTGYFGTSVVTPLVTVNGAGVPVTVNSTNSNGNKIAFLDAGVTRSYVGAGAAVLFQISNSGGTPAYSFSATSLTIPGQITFPATQAPSADANTLDDYEEGTFTPTLTFGGASVGLTYTNQQGEYTKIGRAVHFRIYVRPSAVGSSTGSAEIGSLPFANSGANVAISKCTITLNGALSGVTSTPHAYIVGAASSVTLAQGHATLTLLTNAHVQSGTEFIIAGTYFV